MRGGGTTKKKQQKVSECAKNMVKCGAGVNNDNSVSSAFEHHIPDIKKLLVEN